MKYTAHIQVMPYAHILDPQGKTVCDSLQKLNFNAVSSVRIGKHMILELEASSQEKAYEMAEECCKKLLANPIMEGYEISIHA